MVHSSADYAQPLQWVATYFTLHFIGILTLSTLFLTFVLAENVKRDATLSNLFAVFILYECLSSTVLMSGTLFAGKEPSFGLALFNGCILVGSLPAAACGACCIVTRILTRIVSSQGRWREFADSRILSVVLLASPWLTWLAFIIAALVIGLNDRTLVHKAIFYVTIEQDQLNLASSCTCAAFEVVIIIFELIAAMILISHWRSFRELSRASKNALATATQQTRMSTFSDRFRGLNLGLVFRVGFFGVLVLLALVVALLTLNDFTSPAGDLAVASIGPAVFILFASQRDVLEAWHLVPKRGGNSRFANTSFGNAAPTATGQATHHPTYSIGHGLHPHASDSTLDLSRDESAVQLDEFENKSTDHIYPAAPAGLGYHGAGAEHMAGRKGIWVSIERETWTDTASGGRMIREEIKD